MPGTRSQRRAGEECGGVWKPRHEEEDDDEEEEGGGVVAEVEGEVEEVEAFSIALRRSSPLGSSPPSTARQTNQPPTISSRPESRKIASEATSLAGSQPEEEEAGRAIGRFDL